MSDMDLINHNPVPIALHSSNARLDGNDPRALMSLDDLFTAVLVLQPIEEVQYFTESPPCVMNMLDMARTVKAASNG